MRRWCVRGDATACSPTSLNSIVSNTQAKEIVVDGDANNGKAVFNACQEYERLPMLATANLERKAEILELAHPPMDVNAA
jgi:hypothetical protein